MLFKVLTVSKSPGISSGLTYESDQDIAVGSPVRVPLRNKTVDGIVIDVLKEKESEDFDVKKIRGLIGDQPLLTQGQIQTLRWMANYYCCSLRHALSVFLPSGPWDQLLPQPKTYYKLISDLDVRGKKQQETIDYLRSKDRVKESVLRSETGTAKQTIRSLIDKGIISEEIILESSPDRSLPKLTRPKLTKDQQVAYESITGDDRPSLLFGITASGKTEVYCQLVADVIEAGKQAIVLVPEILLTEHCIHRFEKLIDRKNISIIHSRLTSTEKRDEWRRIHRGNVSLVIGSRSALFSPLPNLGLVIIDEEHEWTYKNEQTPRYHARETAQALCSFSGAKLVMGSATPSIETWSRAKNGSYNLARLSERYAGAELPDVRIIDLAECEFGSMYPFTQPLITAIEERLKKGEQSVLFLNRRGISTALLCLDCRRRIVSPESQLPFTVHKRYDGTEYLLDHTSGLEAALPSKCPGCDSANLRAVGAGTQKIEEILEKRFPNARLLRADSDTLKHPEQMRLLLKKMREGDADILLGTQSVAKGLDLPNVTLAAVLLADIGLSLPHFRAGERIFQLLTQLTGRSGRKKPGEVIIQTFRPDAEEVKCAAEHTTEKYLEDELKLRLYSKYPPACEMVRLIVRGDNAKGRAQMLTKMILQNIKTDADSHVGCSPTIFGGGKVWHVILRGNNLKTIIKSVDLDGIVVDIDPIDLV